MNGYARKKFTSYEYADDPGSVSCVRLLAAGSLTPSDTSELMAILLLFLVLRTAATSQPRHLILILADDLGRFDVGTADPTVLSPVCVCACKCVCVRVCERGCATVHGNIFEWRLIFPTDRKLMRFHEMACSLMPFTRGRGVPLPVALFCPAATHPTQASRAREALPETAKVFGFFPHRRLIFTEYFITPI